jgi:hypothetical protein
MTEGQMETMRFERESSGISGDEVLQIVLLGEDMNFLYRRLLSFIQTEIPRVPPRGVTVFLVNLLPGAVEQPEQVFVGRNRYQVSLAIDLFAREKKREVDLLVVMIPWSVILSVGPIWSGEVVIRGQSKSEDVGSDLSGERTQATLCLIVLDSSLHLDHAYGVEQAFVVLVAQSK